MTRTHRIELWLALLAAVTVVAVLTLLRWQKQKAVTLRGAIVVSDTDPRKQLPIGGVSISADEMQGIGAKSDSSGFFSLTLPKPIRRGHPIVMHFRHPQYKALDLNDYVGNQLYIVRLVPVAGKPPTTQEP